MPHNRSPLAHGRFREDKLGKDRWAVQFYSFTAGALYLIVDHLETRDEAHDMSEALNASARINELIDARKAEKKNKQS